MKLAPVVLFVYNRLDKTKIVINKLKKNSLSKKTILYIFSDSHKNFEQDKLKVLKVRKFINKISGFKKIKKIYRSKNYGLKKNIISGLDYIFKIHQKAIILEDDIEVSKNFLKFMNNALEFYYKKENVWHISGWNYKINDSNYKKYDAFFIRNMNCWGWGTWRNRWLKLIINPNNFINKFDSEMIKKFNLENSYDNWSQILRNKSKKLSSWAIFWNATIFLNQGLCLNPINSLTKNIGFDGSGTNSGKISLNNSNFDKRTFFKFPDQIKEDLILRKKIIFYLRLQKIKFFFERLIYKFKS